MNENLLVPNQNTGVIIPPPRSTDWIAGGETGIAFAYVLPDGKWRTYLPTRETQKKRGLDVFGCVTFSALNSIETQVEFMAQAGIIGPTIWQEFTELGFIDIEGNFNASDRFTAKMSGTTINGNNMPAVWDSIRRDGLLPERDWQFIEGMTWDEYYAEIPQELKDKAKKILDILSFAYEFVPPGLIKEHIKQAPIHIAAPVCSPWNTAEVIQRCEITQAQHATMLYGIEDSGIRNDFDHYVPYEKKLAADYFIPYAIKGLVSLKKAVLPVGDLRHNFATNIEFGQTSAEVKILQDALRITGDFSAKVLSTGFYGEITRQAVLSFQVRNNVAPIAELRSVNGRRCGTKTRSKLNQLFNK